VSSNPFSQLSDRAQELLLVGALFLIALVTRAYGIWKWPVTGDEYYTIMYATERASGLVGSAYYALVLLSQSLFGATPWAARLPAVVCGVLSVPAFYVMCRSMLTRRAAVVGALFVVLSEWHLFHSQMARFYSGVFLFGTLSYYFYYLALTKERYVHVALFFASSLAAVSFHATGIFVVVSCGAYSAFLAWYASGRRVVLSGSMARVHLSVCVVAAALVSPKLFGIVESWGVGGGGLRLAALRDMLGVVENMEVVVFVSAMLGLLYLYRTDTSTFFLFAFLVLIPLTSILAFSVFMPPARPRYMLYALPLFFALSGLICTETATGLEHATIANRSVALVVSAVLLVSFLSYYLGRESLSIKDPVRFVQAQYEKGDDVFVFGPSARYNFDGALSVNMVYSKALWRRGLVPVAEREGRTWIIVDTYRTAPIRGDLETWLMENASLKWRKEETRFDYTQRGYEVWAENVE
jgi:4-amino-4-deoxy-L-arabinose transferase-like glycosyltransferase